MRERAIATLGVWAAVVVSITGLLNSLTVRVFVPYTYDIPLGEGAIQTINQVREQWEFVGGDWQYIVAGLIIGLIIGAALSTGAIWRNAIEHREMMAAAREEAARQDAKIKREEQARAAYALDDAADEEIAAQQRYARLNDDGELYARR